MGMASDPPESSWIEQLVHEIICCMTRKILKLDVGIISGEFVRNNRQSATKLPPK